MAEHEHNFTFGGVVYKDTVNAHGNSRSYYNFFYCTICLEKRYEVLPVRGDSSYSPIRFNATPMAY
jgi:hypothetical protein